jgi:hypothetical protein
VFGAPTPGWGALPIFRGGAWGPPAPGAPARDYLARRSRR